MLRSLPHYALRVAQLTQYIQAKARFLRRSQTMSRVTSARGMLPLAWSEKHPQLADRRVSNTVWQ